MSTIENEYQETDLGNVSLNPRGEYDPGASYEYLDTVSYQGGSYTCLAELGTTITGTAPDPGHNTDAWQMLTLPGDLTPEYIAMHDDTVNHARQAESSRLATERALQAAELTQADVQQLHTDTRQAATEAGQSRDSAADYAQSADASRRAAAESEQNINAQVTGFDTKVSESVTQAQEDIAATRQQAIRAVASQQVTSTQAVKDQTASYIAEKETSAKTEIGNYTSEKVAEINNKASEANITLANTIADGTSLKTQLETTISTADTSKKNLDASDTAAGKTKTALDVSNATATKTKADLDASNTTASEAKTGLDATNKTAADLVVSLGDKITEGTRVKTDIQTTGETAMSNLQAEAAKQQEYIKTSIDDTLSISGKAADAAVTGKKIDSLKEDLSNKITKFYASNQGETHITDSDNGKIQDMQIFGRSEQKKYNGYQLFALAPTNLSTGKKVSLPYTENGITVDIANDGIGYTVRGTNTLNEQQSDIYLSMSNAFDIEAGTYTRSGKIINGNNNVELISGGGASSGGCLEYRANKVGFTFTETVKKGKSGNFVIRISPSVTVNAIVYFQIEKGSEAHDFEPYVGGQPSPSPDYPQEIKSVVNPVVKLTNEDGLKVQSVTLNNITLDAIPVSSGGNVTIDGQQYIADYVDVERGKIVQMVQREKLMNIADVSLTNAAYDEYVFDYADSTKFRYDIVGIINIANFDDISGSNNNETRGVFAVTWGKIYLRVSKMALPQTIEDMKKWLNNNDLYFVLPLISPIETDLTTEQTQALKELVTYYPATNISVNSEQLDGYTVFDYPISMQNGWNYVKQQLNDNRDYIYDMDTQSAEAYVNSEYAVALTELEV